jgi:hypothetical protein
MKYGLNDYLFVDRNILKINPDTVSNTSIVEEYAQLLSALDCEINIMYSGGLDSEIVAEACRRYSIPHRLHFIMLTNRNRVFNDVDYKNAIAFDNNVELHNLDFDQYFESGDFIDFALQYKTTSPQLSCHLKVASDIGSNLVFGGDAMRFNYKVDAEQVTFNSVSPGHFCYDNLVRDTGGIGNMAIASYSLAVKWLRIQADLAGRGIVAKDWPDYTVNFQKYNYSWKCSMYQAAGFDAVPKENKMTGFETIKAFYSDKYNEIGTVRKFDELYRTPLKTIVHLPSVEDIVCLPTNEIKQLRKEFGENYDKSCN